MWLGSAEGEKGEREGMVRLHFRCGVALVSSCCDFEWLWDTEVKQKKM